MTTANPCVHELPGGLWMQLWLQVHLHSVNGSEICHSCPGCWGEGQLCCLQGCPWLELDVSCCAAAGP